MLTSDAIQVFYDRPTADYSGILLGLEEAGASPEHAYKLYQFITIAFAHESYRPQGVTFQGEYILQDPISGARVTRSLSGEPLYQEAVTEARKRLVGPGTTYESLFPVVRHSAEHNAICKLAHGKADVSHIVLVEPILFEYAP